MNFNNTLCFQKGGQSDRKNRTNDSFLDRKLPDYQAKSTILQSIKGIGEIASASIVSSLPELAYMTNKQAAALVEAGKPKKALNARAIRAFIKYSTPVELLNGTISLSSDL